MNFSGFKSGYPLALRSAASIVAFWFLLFISFSVARSLGVPYLSQLGLLNDATTPALATTILQIGLGGTVVGAGSVEASGASFSLAFLLLIVPIGLFYVMRSLSRRYPATGGTPVQSGAYSAAGSVLAIAGLAFLSSGEKVVGSIATSFGFAWIVPAVVAAILGFALAPGALKASVAGRFAASARALNFAFRGLSKFLVTLAVAGACYAALGMGTGLNQPAPYWVWPLVAIGFAIVLPTVSALSAPLFLGATVAYGVSSVIPTGAQTTMNPLTTLRETDYAWVSWTILVVAWLAVLVAAVRNAYKNSGSKQAWLKLTVINVAVALVLTWLGSFRIAGSISGLSFLQAAPSFGNEGFSTIAVFAIAGLVYGLMSHPVMRPLVVLLFEKVGAPAHKVIRGLVFVFGFRWVGPLNDLWAAIGRQKFVVRKAIKYSLVGSLVGLFFLLGAPLAAVTAPLYDSENFADTPLVTALRTGSTTQLVKLVSIDGKTFLGSNGLGDSAKIDLIDPQEVDYQKALDAAAKDHAAAVKKANGKQVPDIKVERPEEKHLRNITWGEKGKYYLNLQYLRSFNKSPFLTVVPQWDVAIVSSSLPKLTLTNGKSPLQSIQVGQKAYLLSDVVILPGLTKVSAGVDKNNFLQSSSIMVDLSKDSMADLKITLNSSKSQEISDLTKSEIAKANPICTTLSFATTGATTLGAVDSSTGLPVLLVKGKGVCDTADNGPIPYSVTATVTYSVIDGKWSFAFKF
jgi:hypothetical protein